MKLIWDFQRETGFELPWYAHEKIRSLMSELQAHDQGTYAHCCRVGEMSLLLSRELNLSLMEQALSLYSGFLHDVGKIKVPAAIINKPTRLSPDEFDIMKKHTVFGVELIESLTILPFFKQVSQAVLYHHERVDGKGYHELSPEQIPLISKLILVVDTVDAMGEDRAYRKGLPMSTIADELLRCSGTQFESQIVNTFLNSQFAKKKLAA